MELANHRTSSEAWHRWTLQNVDAEHPPDQKQGDDGDDKIANPLPGGFRFGSVLHGLIAAVWWP